ncbi:HNH endonuclease [Aquabacter sp. CN5-332]|uniref:HNH endonuclease n=1 Tax=Aquabacter sp. CN5-332 TaxID=3156608 RepID=UPI0032B59CE8
MAARSVEEWIGATPDTQIPPRVRLRVFERAAGRCEVCTRKLAPGDAWQADHTIALVNGGENREANLRCVCGWCHKTKTADDVAEKSRARRVRSKHIGIRKPSTFACSRESRRKKKISGVVVDRLTGEPIGRR